MLKKVKNFFAGAKRRVCNMYSHVCNFFSIIFSLKTLVKVGMGLGFTLAIIIPTPVFADGVSNSLQKVATDFGNYVDPVQKIVFALAAICAIIGSFTIYFKMTNGDQDVKKTIMLTVGGCAALIALAVALPAMFGHTVTPPAGA